MCVCLSRKRLTYFKVKPVSYLMSKCVQYVQCKLYNIIMWLLFVSGSQHANILDKINVSDAKKAGSFMDGCKVQLTVMFGLSTWL